MISNPLFLLATPPAEHGALAERYCRVFGQPGGAIALGSGRVPEDPSDGRLHGAGIAAGDLHPIGHGLPRFGYLRLRDHSLKRAAQPNHQRPEVAQERSRIVPSLAKLKAARLGITTASDAIEIHGGNGYIETWPVARILRDAQINTLWDMG